MLICPLDYRYGRKEMKAVFSEENRLRTQLLVEAALARAHAKTGDIPQEAADTISAKCTTELVKLEREAAAEMGLEVVDATAANSSEVQAAAQSLVGRVDAVSVLTDNTFVSALESVIKVCEQNKLPLIAGDTDSVERGAVAAYAFNYGDLGKQAGDIAAKILGGTPIKDIPVEYAQNLQLAVNEKAAAAMGVTIPAELMSKATLKY